MKQTFLVFLCILFIGVSCTEVQSPGSKSSERKKFNSKDLFNIDGVLHYVDEYPPIDSNGFINVVIEIPTGTKAKWEVDKSTGDLKWEVREGKPRIVQYLGYPGNYGMIPGTLLPGELGGDGDPLDVILLGPRAERGSVVSCKIIGVMELLDNGEQDDKLVAVMSNSPFADFESIEELDSAYNGIDDILRIWFSNYKGPGQMKFVKYSNQSRAKEILDASTTAYRKSK